MCVSTVQGRIAMSRFVVVLWLSVLCIFAVGTKSVLLADEKTDADTGNDSEKTYELRYQFTPGEFVRYAVSDESVVTTRTNQVKETVKNQSEVWRHYRVVSVDEQGTAVLELMIDRVRLEAQFEDADPTIFDSADKNLQPVKFQSLLSSIGKPTHRIRVNCQGKLLSIQNLRGAPVSAPAGTDPSEETDQSINFLVIFPEEPISIGTLWKQTLMVEVPVTNTLKEKVRLLRNYTLKSVENDIAHVEITTVLATTIRDPAVKTRLMQQTPTGSFQFDLKSQQLLSRELKVNDQVVGAFGPNTLVETKSLRVEKRIDEKQPVSKTKSCSPETSVSSSF